MEITRKLRNLLFNSANWGKSSNYLLNRVVILWVMLTFLIAGLVGIAHTMRLGSQYCLRLSASVVSGGLLDPNTGASINIFQNPIDEKHRNTFLGARFYETSPDNKYTAMAIGANQLEEDLFIVSSASANPNYGRWIRSEQRPSGSFYEILDGNWSPNSQWLAYLSEDADHHIYLGLTSPDGYVQHEVLVATSTDAFDYLDNVPQYPFYFGWSADGMYLAAAVPDDVLSGALYIWAMPDFHLTRILPYHLSYIPATQPELAAWSTHGHQLAYIADMSANQTHIVISFPDQADIQVALPFVAYGHGGSSIGSKASTKLIWSPGDQHLAAISTARVGDRLDLISPDRTVVNIAADRVVEHGRLGELPIVYWAADGRTIRFLFAYPNAASQLNMNTAKLESYRIEDQSYANLADNILIGTGQNLEGIYPRQYPRDIVSDDPFNVLHVTDQLNDYLIYGQWNSSSNTTYTMIVDLNTDKQYQIGAYVSNYLPNFLMYDSLQTIQRSSKTGWLVMEWPANNSLWPPLSPIDQMIWALNLNTGAVHRISVEDQTGQADSTTQTNPAAITASPIVDTTLHLLALSPDGQQVAYVSEISTQPYLRILTLDTEAFQDIALPHDSGFWGSTVIWSPDSSSVMLSHYATQYTWGLDKVMLVNVADGLTRQIDGFVIRNGMKPSFSASCY